MNITELESKNANEIKQQNEEHLAKIAKLEQKIANNKLIGNGGKRWKAEEGETYLCISSCGGLHKATENFRRYDDECYKSGNYYKNAEEATQARDKQLAIVRVNDAIMLANSTCDIEDDKWHYYACFAPQLTLKCVDKEIKHAHALIPCVHINIAEELIKDYESDLKLIFGVE